jgi:hypothetical protein
MKWVTVLSRKQKRRLHNSSGATGLSGLFQLVPRLREIVPQRQGARVIRVRLHERGYPLDSATLECRTCRALASPGPFFEFRLTVAVQIEHPTNHEQYRHLVVIVERVITRNMVDDLNAEAAFRTHRRSPLPKPPPK